MTRRRAEPTEPIDAISTTRVDPLRENDAEIWRRWGADRAVREMAGQARAETAAAERLAQPIHPRELAAKIADELRDVAPDWRLYRPQMGLYWGQLLRAQPECDPKVTRQREALIVALLNNVPAHVRPIVAELRPLMELAFVGHECAAFAIAWEAGRFFERQQIAIGAPGPPTPAVQAERTARTRSELSAMVHRLQHLGDMLDCDVEITVRPRRASDARPHPQPHHATEGHRREAVPLRLTIGE